jgi:hypothetical protein
MTEPASLVAKSLGVTAFGVDLSPGDDRAGSSVMSGALLLCRLDVGHRPG